MARPRKERRCDRLGSRQRRGGGCGQYVGKDPREEDGVKLTAIRERHRAWDHWTRAETGEWMHRDIGDLLAELDRVEGQLRAIVTTWDEWKALGDIGVHTAIYADHEDAVEAGRAALEPTP